MISSKKTIGIIGGIGPESTVDYYRLIIKGFHKVMQTEDYPRILINSINMTGMMDFINNGDYDGLADMFRIETGKLARAGADFAVIAANTPHLVFDRIKTRSPIELLSIVEETRKRAQKLELRKLGLIGTKFTMQGGFYQKEFLNFDIEVFTPDEESQDYINDIYFKELMLGNFSDKTISHLIGIAEDMVKKNKIDGLILGGTELPLLLSENDFDDIAILNSTEIHVHSIIEQFIA
jgi:aspartate racemase